MVAMCTQYQYRIFIIANTLICASSFGILSHSLGMEIQYTLLIFVGLLTTLLALNSWTKFGEESILDKINNSKKITLDIEIDKKSSFAT